MKLRLRADTLRLRLTRSETDAVGRGEAVVEQTRFANGSTLTYRLVPGVRRDARHEITDSGACMHIEIPREEGSRWAASDEVGFSGEAPFRAGPLAVLIEKDFACLSPRATDEELDTFPNPKAESTE